ncbi:MAG: DUF1232 domain-containing protein [Anaerolineaceae bacterium]|nr:DUF1232 domain-containing protein [Anaerolineaceae bacterium]
MSASNWLTGWKERVRQLKMDTYALYLAYRDPRVPWYAKVFSSAVVAYAFSPIDLVPDFIPVLGYLDDLILVPLGLIIAFKMIPAPVMVECRVKAKEQLESGKPVNWWAAAVIILIWLIMLGLGVLALVRIWNGR